MIKNEPKLIVGLGNWPEQFEKTRHNTGFMAIDAYCQAKGLELNKQEFQGKFTTFERNGSKVFICKPLTLMNLSGEFIATICKFYKIPKENILVFCDDIYLPVGKMRIRPRGSSGGQNGLKNIIAHLGGEDFGRCRIGIDQPDTKRVLVSYVLSEFTKQEETLLRKVWPNVIKLIDDFIDGKDFNQLAKDYNL